MTEQNNWVEACTEADLGETGKKIVKFGAKQILLLKTEGGLYAFNNRCPHEGYPLAEGNVTGTCTLTCNWHNWKFDLSTGETLVGGDTLRHYPLEVRDGAIWLDIADPSPEEQAPGLLKNLKDAREDYDYARIARELARFDRLGLDLTLAVEATIWETHDHFEYGMTHAFAAAADWLSLSKRETDPAKRLITFVEPIAHMAWDSLRHPQYPFTEETLEWDASAFVNAIEDEDENQAVALTRGGLKSGLTYKDFEPHLAQAALAHYADFGHSAIYTVKAGELDAHLDGRATEPILLALIRQLVYQTREDLIPEFSDYAPALEGFQNGGEGSIGATDLRGLSTRRALDAVASSGASPQDLFNALLDANLWNFLHFDLAYQEHTDLNLSKNVGWLDHTHTLTFANAVHTLCVRTPSLWPQALMQMACFLGRNSPFADKDLDTSEWEGTPFATLSTQIEETLFDHAQFEHIVSGHLIKIIEAAKEEVARQPDAPWVPLLSTTLNRFYNSSVKRRHVMRTAKQALDFVETEG